MDRAFPSSAIAHKRHVAILIAGSRNAAFYSQIAAIAFALRALPWRRWRPSVHVYFGGVGGPDRAGEHGAWEHWGQYLKDVHVTDVNPESFARKQNWAQVDATLELAPPDADVLISLDADTLPVDGFEDVLDRVADEDLIAGVIAHFPPSTGQSPREDWTRAAEGIIDRPLTFRHRYSLEESADPRRLAPFYVNGGVVFYSRSCFDRFVPLYLELRPKLSTRLANDAFSGQVASTLAVTEAGLNTWALPMRYNFPNDRIAEQLHPHEAANVVIYHYLRAGRFDRHQILATREAFEQFLELPLDGPDSGFQRALRRLFGSRYPFA